MSRITAWTVHISALAVILTGLVYGWMRYFAESEDPYAIANHPWQPTFQHLHILAAPVFVFACGLIWAGHVAARVSSGHWPGRYTGLLLWLVLFPMIASGYLLQVSVDEFWRKAWISVHIVSSVLWAGAYACHLFSGHKQRGKKPQDRNQGDQTARSKVLTGVG